MACADFPLCQGQAVPAMDFTHAFTLWRPLGLTGDGEAIPFQALVAIHWTHRVFALGVILALGALLWQVWNAPGEGYLTAAEVRSLQTGVLSREEAMRLRDSRMQTRTPAAR